MEPIKLGIKFVKEAVTTEDIAAQTGDFTPILIALLLFLLVASAGIIFYLRNRHIIKSKHLNIAGSFVRGGIAINRTSKIIIATVSIIAVIGIMCCCFASNAFAKNNEGTLVTDKNEITATVSQDGILTLDTCNLKNVGIQLYDVDKSSVSVAADAPEDLKDALAQSQVKILGFSGTLHDGEADGSVYQTSGLYPLLPNASTMLRFQITLNDEVDINKLLEKNIFDLSLTPAESDEYGLINFTYDGIRYFPIFGNNSLPEGVKLLDESYNPIPEKVMSGRIHYAMAPKGTTLNAVRSHNQAQWSAVFEQNPQHGEALGVKDSYKQTLKTGEEVLILLDETGKYDYKSNPLKIRYSDGTYSNFLVQDIWDAYYPFGFGRSDGIYWAYYTFAYTPTGSECAYSWWSKQKCYDFASVDLYYGVIISKGFTA